MQMAELKADCFQFLPNILLQKDCKDISDWLEHGGLGCDPISELFVKREKAIRYLKVVDGGLELSNKNSVT